MLTDTKLRKALGKRRDGVSVESDAHGNPPRKPVCLSVEFSRHLNRGDLHDPKGSEAQQSRFTDSQTMSILKQAETGTPVAELESSNECWSMDFMHDQLSDGRSVLYAQ